MDLKNLDYPALIALLGDIEKEIAAREAAEKENARRQIMDLARNYGLSIEEVLNPAKNVRKPVEAKYRNPENGQTWSGRGRKPSWITDLLAQGRTLEEFAVQ
ncbi:MAG: H-NS histone family protein [Laribacter sp.]|nr:H-NS histone family protein [Laribacter sp.]MBP9609279.1 H-NS histone family protein [Laribacter sp.]